LLVVNSSKRYTTKQALHHPWIVGNNSENHLSAAIEQLKHFNAKKELEKGMNAVLAMGRFKGLSISGKKA